MTLAKARYNKSLMLIWMLKGSSHDDNLKHISDGQPVALSVTWTVASPTQTQGPIACQGSGSQSALCIHHLGLNLMFGSTWKVLLAHHDSN